MAFRWTHAGRARHGGAVLSFLACLFALLPASPLYAADVASVVASARQIVIRFDGKAADASATLLDGPRRIAVEVPGVAADARVTVGGPVAGVRRQPVPGGTRLVFDLSRPAVVADGGFDRSGRTLTLSLAPADAAAFRQASMAGPLSLIPFDVSFGAADRYRVTVPIPATAKAAPLPRVRGDDSRPLVVIDAGHGGVDPGAINTAMGLREKDLTLKVARAIRDRLLAGGRVRVALTRNDDRYLVLRERYGIARRLKADLFISIHCDSAGAEGATGASVYTLSEVASDKEAARLAARENKADVIAGVDLGDTGADVSSILIDLARRETMNSSATFARLLGREAKPLVPMKANFHRMASLMVLKAPDMPSILFETGYISNPADAAFLDSNTGRTRIAESVRRAVEAHFARRMAAR
ncbi:N-acetylmuramoyl-L-alanine amidase family protein [Sphingomonas aurea]|uniref:N-acetylmuramoyl-L-alanine amidase family protein n=1 Tax=Sphingomonas aurea TaxID=3063994 RepID=UPI00351D005F